MGIFGKSTPYQVILEPFDPPIGFNAAFCSPNIETLHMKEKFSSFKDVDIAIKNDAGQQVLTCHCKGGSFTNQKGEIFFILSPQRERRDRGDVCMCLWNANFYVIQSLETRRGHHCSPFGPCQRVR